MARLREFFIAIMMFCVSSSLTAATLTVDLNGGGDYTDIQSAIDAAKDGDTVLVKPGEYVITAPVSFKGKAIAVKSEAGAAATTIRMSESPADPNRAAVVVFENKETGAARLEGFTITGGLGNLYNNLRRGGGLEIIIGSSPRITDCAIQGNSTGEGGGFFSTGSPTFTRCRISGNTSEGAGGGLHFGNRLQLIDCTVTENIGKAAGGLAVIYGDAVLSGCDISHNSQVGMVGGPAGGIVGGNCNMTLTNCRIVGNTSEEHGAISHMGSRESSTFRVTNCLIVGNQGPLSAIIMICDDGNNLHGEMTMDNCTIAGNSTGLEIYTATWSIKNSIVSDAPFDRRGAGTIEYSCIPGASPLPGAGNIASDPLFVDPAALDYHLRAGSPCIEAGTAIGAPAADLDGVLRPQGAEVDIGAYEHFPDCNGNGVPDSTDISSGTSKDCNGNGIPDECDIASGTSMDQDGDGIPDECSPPGGIVLPGDANGDGELDIPDAVNTLSILFLGGDKVFPCGDGGATNPANVKLIDWQPDGTVDISDAVAMLNFLFTGGRAHTLAPEVDAKGCVRIVGCTDSCGD